MTPALSVRVVFGIDEPRKTAVGPTVTSLTSMMPFLFAS
jgi:hypothetical protein